MSSEQRSPSIVRRWRRYVVGPLVAIVALVAFLASSDDGRDVLSALPWLAADLGAKKDWWAGEGTTILAAPPPLSDRIGNVPFHWRILIHRTADAEASVTLCLTRTPSTLPDRPSRDYWAYGHAQKPGLGDRAVMQIDVRLPWEEFSEPWHKALGGQWHVVREEAELVVVATAVEERISLHMDDESWREILAYHYWQREDGLEPSPRQLPR